MTPEKRAELRERCTRLIGPASHVSKLEVLSLLDALDAAERELAEARESAAMACEQPDSDCQCAGCLTANDYYRSNP